MLPRRVFILPIVFIVATAEAAKDWVVRVHPGGVADKVAQEHDLVNLGEVVPDSGLYHFRDDRKRKRRSPGDLEASLTSHPHVAEAEAQTTSLKRVKRIPLPEHEPEDPVHDIMKRQATGRSTTGNQLCFINTVSTATKEARRCIFPFSYKGKTYVSCTADHSSNGEEWCGTQV